MPVFRARLSLKRITGVPLGAEPLSLLQGDFFIFFEKMVAGEAVLQDKISALHDWTGDMYGHNMGWITSRHWLIPDLEVSSKLINCWFFVTFLTHFSTSTPKITSKRVANSQYDLIFWEPISLSLSVVKVKFLHIKTREEYAFVLLVAKKLSKINDFQIN